MAKKIIRITEEDLGKVVKEATQKVLQEEKLITEMARININENERCIFPYNSFEVKMWSNDHEPPHFHVICDGWNISFTIEDGRELEVKNIGRNSSTYNYIVKNIPIWLDMPCKIAPKISNRENAFIQWQQLHEEEL